MKKTLCWDCKKACGGENGCSWFNGFIPIPGWDIEENEFGYKIKKCPQFIQDEQFVAHRDWIRIKTKDLADLLGISGRDLFRHSEDWMRAKLKIFGYSFETDVIENRKRYWIRRNDNEQRQ